MIYDANTTVADALAAWDRGDTIWSVEMGGLGPGYEQCIQLLIVELLRAQGDTPLPDDGDKEAWGTWGDVVSHRVSEECGGMTGAQVGAAQSCAARMLRVGYGAALLEMKGLDADRLIQVSRDWPRAAALPLVVP